MKRETIKGGPITLNKALSKAWITCWEEIDIQLVRKWIKRLLIHIKEVIKQDGNNLYKEGRKAGTEKRRIH